MPKLITWVKGQQVFEENNNTGPVYFSHTPGVNVDIAVKPTTRKELQPHATGHRSAMTYHEILHLGLTHYSNSRGYAV